VLDYFGSTVNTAARLEHQCRGGEVLISEEVLTDDQAHAALGARRIMADSATTRGLNAPVGFVRVAPGE
jgi:class 3 adenylate cyclase